jgi:hypothetical protein
VNCRKFFISADHTILIADNSFDKFITTYRRQTAFAEKEAAFTDSPWLCYSSRKAPTKHLPGPDAVFSRTIAVVSFEPALNY